MPKKWPSWSKKKKTSCIVVFFWFFVLVFASFHLGRCVLCVKNKKKKEKDRKPFIWPILYVYCVASNWQCTKEIAKKNESEEFFKGEKSENLNCKTRKTKNTPPQCGSVRILKKEKSLLSLTHSMNNTLLAVTVLVSPLVFMG